MGIGIWKSSGGAVTPKTLFGSRLLLWSRADLGVTLTSGVVSAWADQSTSANHWTQGTTANRPAVSASAINGKPAISFDGSNDFLATSGNITLGVCTIVMVAKFYRTASTEIHLEHGTDYNADNTFIFATDSATSGANTRYVSDSRTAGVSDYSIKSKPSSTAWARTELSIAATHAAMEYYIDGTGGASTVGVHNKNMGTTSRTKPLYLAGRSGAVVPSQMDLFEIMAIDGQITVAERAALANYHLGQVAI